MHVAGTASASILPSPSLTFTDVRVGDDQNPMMTVARFEVTVELTPLLQGEVHVDSMTLVEPDVRVTADLGGALDWLKRPSAGEEIDPDRFTFADVEIKDGSIAYADSAAGLAIAFAHINATVEATSLAGPWHVDGSYLDDGKAVSFRFASGRRLDDGTIRVKTDFSPVRWPVDVSLDGVLGVNDSAGLTYSGTYGVTEVVDSGEGGGDAAPAASPGPDDAAVASPDTANPDTATGWRSEGTYVLSRDGLVIDKAVLSNGPADRPTSLAGSLTIRFGPAPSFDALAESRQLDFDRTFAGGPGEPVKVSDGFAALVAWLSAQPIPQIPGHIRFNVPAIVAGGSIVQDVGFDASPAERGWRIKGFHAGLPGEASLTADGVLSTDRSAGFAGDVHLAVLQPAAFASWWRNGAGGAGQALVPFDIRAHTDIGPGKIEASGIDARIGDATITGSAGWSVEGKEKVRAIGATLKADRVDFAQVKALGDLLVGHTLAGVSALADNYTLDITADAVQFGDILLKGVAVNGSYANDVLNIVRLGANDIGGASFKVTSGQIKGLTGASPVGRIDAHLDASNLDGLTAIVAKLAPDSGLYDWLSRTAPALVPAGIEMHVLAPPKNGGSGLRMSLNGDAGQTKVDVTAETEKEIGNWRDAGATFDVTLESPDSAALAGQLGFVAKAPGNDAGGRITAHAAGIPSAGLDATVDASFAGVVATANGRLTLGSETLPAFKGTLTLDSDDADPFIAAAGLSIPGAAAGTKLALKGDLDLAGGSAAVSWQNATFGDRAVSGSVTLARASDQGWHLDGNLDVDAVDLDWLMSLGLGFAPMPTGDASAPWSKAPFGPPTYGPVTGKLTVDTDHFAIGSYDVADANLAIDLQPQRIDAALSNGHVAGGVAAGSVSIGNVDGNADVTLGFDLKGAALQSFIWQRDGRAVATGTLDVSGSVEATGRTPAGLISTATGGGVIAIHDGEARYVNPNTARQVVRASDLGQEFTDEELARTLADAIDADSISFDEAGTAFSAAAGAIRLNDLAVRAPGVEASGDAVIDLNAMTLDSDWTLKFDPGDDKVQGTDPKLGLVFRGPLAAPTRQIDALPFSSYLNTRRAARMLEIIATEEADRAEHERFSRLIVKLKQDRERVAREAAEAEERERRRAEIAALAVARIAAAHVEHEAEADEREAARLQRAVERAVAAQAAAERAAADAAAHAEAERARAVAARDALAAAVAADEKARADLAIGARALAAAQAETDTTKATAASDLAAADAAEKAALDARAAESAARDALARAQDDLVAANQALDAATSEALAARRTADAATAAAAKADADLKAAGSAVSDAANASDAAVAARTAAAAALADAEQTARQTDADATATAEAAAAALKARNDRQADLAAASDAVSAAAAVRDNAATALDRATADAATADAALANAQQLADQSAALAANQPPDSIDPGDPDSPQSTRRAAMAWKARADHAKQVLDGAQSAFDEATAAVAAAAARLKAAQAALEDAATRADAAQADAARAAAARTVAAAALEDRTRARAAAIARATELQVAAEKAGAAFNDAETADHDAADRAAAASAAAADAEAARVAAAQEVARATSAASAAAFASASASDLADTTIAEALRTRGVADASTTKAVTAASALAGLSADNETATAAAEAAAAARADAEKALADAEASAAAAEEAATRAAENAKAHAAETAAADRRAGLAPPAETAATTATADDAAAPPPPAPVPAPPRKPRSSQSGGGPIIITPPYNTQR